MLSRFLGIDLNDLDAKLSQLHSALMNSAPVILSVLRLVAGGRWPQVQAAFAKAVIALRIIALLLRFASGLATDLARYMEINIEEQRDA